MCGIFGFLGLKLSHDRSLALLLAMEDRLKHRGPDERVFRNIGDLYFGVRRLSITDPEHGQQPFCTPDGSVTCIFNGEIYNYHDLRDILDTHKSPLQTNCDGEVIPFLYTRYGARVFDLLDGMYAVALWDNRDQSLILTVDHQGEKPLYLGSTPNGGWLFASELKALLAYDDLAVEPDMRAIRRYLLYKAVFHPLTGLRGIEKLRPAEQVLLRVGAEPRRSITHFADQLASQRAFLPEELATVLRRAVRTTLPENMPVGFLLSGGLDSSLVLALAAEYMGSGLPAFSIGYEGVPALQDERRFARAAAHHAEADLYEVEISPRQVLPLLRKTVWHLDEPNQDPITVPSYAVFGAARERVRVVLTGDGADELFAGYRRLLPLTRKAPPGGLTAYLRGLQLWSPEVVDQLLRPEITAGLTADDSDRPIEPHPVESLLQSALHFERRFRLPGYHLSRVDRLSMAWGLEARAPFLRREPYLLATLLRDRQLIYRGVGKALLRRAAKTIVADRTLARQKQAFTFPLVQWLSGPLLAEVTERLCAHGSWVQTLFWPGVVENCLRNLRAGGVESASFVWALLVLEEWGELFLRRRGALP
jgi:asparagine synthase (glutamine-hydrolysing)